MRLSVLDHPDVSSSGRLFRTLPEQDRADRQRIGSDPKRPVPKPPLRDRAPGPREFRSPLRTGSGQYAPKAPPAGREEHAGPLPFQAGYPPFSSGQRPGGTPRPPAASRRFRPACQPDPARTDPPREAEAQVGPCSGLLPRRHLRNRSGKGLPLTRDTPGCRFGTPPVEAGRSYRPRATSLPVRPARCPGKDA